MTGVVQNYVIDMPYYASALDVYNSLPNSMHTILLESTEIKTRFARYSLIVAKSAVRIVADSHSVTVYALSPNGKNCIAHVADILRDYVTCFSADCVEITFPVLATDMEESERVKSVNVLSVLRVIKDDFAGGDVYEIFSSGVMGFDLLDSMEDLPVVAVGDNTCPAYVYYVAETVIKIDHIEHTSQVIGTVFSGDNDSVHMKDIYTFMEEVSSRTPQAVSMEECDTVQAVSLGVSMTDSDFKDTVNKAQEYIKRGDVFQVVPSRVFSIACTRPLESYLALKTLNPSPYMFYMHDSDFIVFGASPECALKYTADTNIVSVYPIAGTRPRGKNKDGSINLDLDSRLELEMRMDTKEVSEHIMLVDLARNDIARISAPATRRVSSLMHIDKYSHVQHLVSEVQGYLKSDYDCLHAYQLCMNMGTLTGAPKVRASEIIRTLELTKRGSYGGAIGYINSYGDMDSCIVIRSAFVKDGMAYIGAGAGVVLDSVPQLEADETRIKALSVITAIATAHGYTLSEGEVS